MAALRGRAGTGPWWSPVGRSDPDTGPAAGPAPPLTRTGRPARAARPGSLPPARALAGALVAVAGVALGIGTLLWATDAPAGDPAVRPPDAISAGADTGTDGGTGTDGEPTFDEPAVEVPADLPATEQPPEVPVEAPAAPQPPPPPPAAAAPPAPAPPVEVPLLVLNNSRISGLADRAAADFRAGGWPVRDTGNSRGRIRATTVYYPPGQEAVARELARRFPAVQRVLPRLPNLPGDGLTVVVTRDYAA